MNKNRLIEIWFAKLFCIASCLIISLPMYSTEFAPLPEKITNNAVAAILSEKGWLLYSFNGLGVSKDHKAVRSSAWAFSLETNQWKELAKVPDSTAQAGGRLASIAVAVAGKIYLFGGYTVAEDHTEISTPETNVFNPKTNQWSQMANMPVPVDDSVALVYQNRYIYLISGWHNNGNVKAVQILDTVENTWSKATDFPGAAVFGQAAGMVDNQFIVANGVKVAKIVDGKRQYQISDEVWQGVIDTEDKSIIKWTRVADLPGGGRYRMAASGDDTKPWVYFVGGSLNPYNYNGIGYNGIPSNPEEMNYAFDLQNNQWLACGKKTPASMDHRGLIKIDDKLLTIGGMLKDQQVTAEILIFNAQCK